MRQNAKANNTLKAELAHEVGGDSTGALLFANLMGDDVGPNAWLELSVTFEKNGQLLSPEIDGDRLDSAVFEVFTDQWKQGNRVRYVLAFLKADELTISLGFADDLAKGESPFSKYEQATLEYFGRPWIAPKVTVEPDNIQIGIEDLDIIYELELKLWRTDAETHGIVVGATQENVRLLLLKPDIETPNKDIYLLGTEGILTVEIVYDANGVATSVEPSRTVLN